MADIIEYDDIYNNMMYVSKDISLKDLSLLITKKLTVMDPDTYIIWAIDGTKIIQIPDKSKLKLAKGLLVFTRDFIDDFKKGKGKEDLFKGCLGVTEEYFSSGIYGADYSKSQDLLFNTIKEEINSGNPARKEYAENQIKEFFKDSLQNIPDKMVGFEKGKSKESIKEQKEWTRAYFIAAMMQEGVIDFDLLVNSGEIYNYKFNELDCAFRKSGAFSKDELIQALLLNKYFNSEEDILDYYLKNDKKYFFEMSSSKDLAIFLLKGKFKNESDRNTAVRKMQMREFSEFSPDLVEDFFRVQNLPKNNFIKRSHKGNFISNELMNELSRESILRVLYSKKVKYKTSLESNDFVNMYGKLNFADLEILHRDKFVNAEDIIKIIKFINIENENGIKSNLTNFYNMDKLEEILIENRVNSKFIENFNRFTNEILNKDEKEKYFTKLKEELKSKENRDELIFLLQKKGFNFDKFEGYQINPDKISERYLEESLTDSDILALHDIGVVSDDVISEIFGEEGIKEGYRTGKLDVSALALIDNDIDFLMEEFNQGRLNIQNLLTLYSMPNGIGLADLDTILADVDLTEYEIGELLPDNISAEKVEELFKSYYISHDELGDLVGRNIITQEQSDRFAEELASDEEYENIFSGQGIALLTNDTEGESYNVGPRTLGGTSNPRNSQVKNDPFLQELLLDKIGFDDRRLQLQGENNSLNGYMVYPSKELGVMIFYPEKVGNATYVMSLPQGMFFLKRINVNHNEKSKVQSTATKQELRETEHVKVRNACRGWGKNIVDSIKQLSPEMRKKLKDDSKYKDEIDLIVQEIKEDYDRRK